MNSPVRLFDQPTQWPGPFVHALYSRAQKLALPALLLLLCASGAKASPAIDPFEVKACEILFDEKAKVVRRAMVDRIVHRASERLNAAVPGAKFEYVPNGPEFSITASGIPDGVAYINARVSYISRTKLEPLDYVPGDYGMVGKNPIVTLKISEVRVQDRLAVKGEGRFRRKGIGAVLMRSAVEMSQLIGIRRITGRLDQTVKEMFCKEFDKSKDVVKATEASFSGMILKAAGYEVDLENSRAAHYMLPNCLDSTLYITWKK